MIGAKCIAAKIFSDRECARNEVGKYYGRIPSLSESSVCFVCHPPVVYCYYFFSASVSNPDYK
jgi:hypothetical protein